ncbi:class I SAM-dependent RNA methyltransferase [Ancylobacter defluvii]|uniref:RNA methyltransferase n=1 Tax=Ancylobacter defluvii TaxID=1282440 RepID=A0A9W6NC53_9HYPH|nr:class I SAM-dependent RNA methyltransferase [Ancylobacter defluvii]MBS7589653.1 class I SAM-dependent RNA methyltransferase [Ancylobacter defluvii]GLK85272.1 putative RNA methyltransferase [Ancylobacter defluvii]
MSAPSPHGASPHGLATLRIDRLGHRGDGIADTPDGPVFVPLALAGERVEVERQGERARLVSIVEASPERVDPFCRHVGVCGGCAFQHWQAEPYRAWKRSLVVEALARVGIETDVAPLVDAHGEGRRRATFHARGTGGSAPKGLDTLAVGFAGWRSHAVVAIDACPILAPSLAGALPAAWALAQALAPVAKPLDIQVTATETGLDVDVRGSGPLKPRSIAALAALAEAHKLARLTRHGELVLQREPPLLTMGRARVPLPPGSFLQATTAGEATLAALVAEATKGARHIADLFSGVGTFGLRLAERARVAAYESSAPAVEALNKAVRGVSGLKPVTGEARDLFRRPLLPLELKAFDAVVFDPPRQGAEAQSVQLAASKVPLVVGVSCDPVTFARDAALLIEGGYRLEHVTPVDQFRYSAHVELVGVFRR